jgi:hypothetical protein
MEFSVATFTISNRVLYEIKYCLLKSSQVKEQNFLHLSALGGNFRRIEL